MFMTTTATEYKGVILPVTFLLLVFGSLNRAYGDLLYQTTVDISGSPGHLVQVLSLKNNGTEAGCVWWNGSTSQVSSSANPCPVSGITNAGTTGGTTATIASVVGLAANGASYLSVIFNGAEPGSAPGLTIEKLILTFYDPSGVTLYSASLASPYYIPDAGTGGGTSGFLFRMDYDQYTAAQAVAFSGPNFGQNRIGLAAEVSGTAGAAENFYLSAELGTPFPEPAVPEPASLLTVGTGLMGVAFFLKRRKRRSPPAA